MAPEGPASVSHTRAARLRARLAGRYALRDIAVALDGLERPPTITAPADPDAPLDEMAAEQARRGIGGAGGPSRAAPADGPGAAASAARATIAAGAHLPYWALLWPSGLALAQALLERPEAVRGRQTLELGCGLGSTAAVALTLGARLTVSDLFPDALLFAAYNTQRHAGDVPARLLLNWRTAAGRSSLQRFAPVQTLLAADVLYEEDDIPLLLALVPALLAPGGTLWLAEPGRKASRAFVAAALTRSWPHSETTYQRSWPPDGDTVRVSVHRFTLPSAT
jgi:predicted nicotinamide N-methyase